MSNRAGAMATIDAALTGPSPAAPPPPDVPVTAPSATQPGAAPPAPGSKEAKEQEKAEAKAAKEEERAAKEAADRQASQVDAITGVAKSTFETEHPMGLDFFKLHNIASMLESVPTPGSFWFPFILLLLLFFLLVPANGHTRAVWLWMAITGSAEIDYSSLGGTSGQQGTPPVQPPPPTQPSFGIPQAPTIPTFTSVEGS